MLFKELEGREIIDKKGNRIAVVEDVVISNNGKVTHIIGMPTGIVDKATRGKMHINFKDVAALEDFVMLRVEKEELA